MHLRPATPIDLDLLRRWDEAPHVIAADPHDDWNWEVELARNPEWREQLVAEVDDVPIGFVQIIDPAREDSHYWGDCPDSLRAIDIWIGEAGRLGRGFGTRMMTAAIERCFEHPSVQAILIDPLASNARARRFYERLGFRFVEVRRFGDDDCAVYGLDRVSWAARHDSRGRARVTIRAATAVDCEAVTELCMRSKRSWGYDEDFMDRSRTALTLTPERVEAWTVRVAERPGGELTGVAASSARNAPREAELELMFVEPAWTGTGVGRALMEDLADRLVDDGIETLWILSDPGAETFYRRLGAVRLGLRPSDAIPGRRLPWLRLDLGASGSGRDRSGDATTG